LDSPKISNIRPWLFLTFFFKAMARKQTISIVLRLAIIAATGFGWFKGLIQPHLQVEETMPVNWKLAAAVIAFLFTMRNL
jgi:hypothetical protein